MPADYHIAEFHLFQMLRKNILSNVDTMLSCEMSPVVYDIADLIPNPGHPDPLTSLTNNYPEQDLKEAVAYLMKEPFLTEGQAPQQKNRVRLTKRHDTTVLTTKRKLKASEEVL